MTALYHFLHRNWIASVSPPESPKQSDALRFGLFGASTIAPKAIIGPAKSHPEVIVAAVAARDQTRAEAYAKKHGIPIVHKSYQDMLDDPTIDAVYIPLPNGLHYEWAIKSLKAGKHVLLEKPSTSNAEEAKKLFNHPILKQPNAPVILEAFHYRFHPAWQAFLSLIKPSCIISASSVQYLGKGYFPKEDIRFKYHLAGGTLMDFGTYNVSCLRQIFRTEPEACLEASYRPVPGGDKEIDQAFKAKWRFPNGGLGSIEADLAATGGYWFPWLTKNWPKIALPKTTVELLETKQPDGSLNPDESHVIERKATFSNPLMPTIYHRIDVEERHLVRRGDEVVRSWTENRRIKAYKWPDNGERRAGEEWWTTYRYQLEEFVNAVKKRPGSGVWVSGDDSIKQMEMIDGAYLKAGLPLRPTSSYE